MKNNIVRDITKRLLHTNKYYLLPNSQYSVAQKVNPIIYLDLSTKSGHFGKIRIRLFQNIVPKTVENYKRLLLGNATYQGRSLSLINSVFDKIYTNAYIHGGNLSGGNHSIYGKTFRDESYAVLHDRPGLLSSLSEGNTNSSEFFITLAPCPYLDYKNVVFGEVIEGEDILNRIQSLGSSDGRVRQQIRISGSGEQAVQDDHHGAHSDCHHH